METTSALYRRLLAAPEHINEIKISVAGVEYSQDHIISCTLSGDIFTTMTVGDCISREIEMVLIPQEDVPRMGQIAVYGRLTLGNEASEWVPQGVFFIDTRSVDEVSGFLTLHGFDTMLKAEAVWWDPSEDMGKWPMSQAAAVEDIARQLETTLDARTRIEPDYQVEYPNDLTMREVLGHIAAAHGGNWFITDSGKLLLLPLGVLPEETNLLVDSADGGAILFGEVRILV